MFEEREERVWVVFALLLLGLAVGGTVFVASEGEVGVTGAFVDVRTSDIVGGDGFLQGSTVEIQYAVETEVAGQVKFLVDGEREAQSGVPVDGSGTTQQTYTYRADSLSVGNHTYKAVFEAADGTTYDTPSKQIQIVESEERIKTGTEPSVRPQEPQDPPISFGRSFETEYFPNYGFRSEKTFPLVNNRDEELLVTVEVPPTNDCQYVLVQENPSRTSEFGKRGNYELPPADEGVRKVQTRKEFQIAFAVPEKERFEAGEVDTINCPLRVTNGATSDEQELQVVADPSASGVTRGLTNIQKAIASDSTTPILIGGISLLALFIIGVLATRFSVSLDSLKVWE